MTTPLAKRADQLTIGDRIAHKYLPSTYAEGPGEVVYVKAHAYRDHPSVFVAYVHEDGYYDSTSYLPDGDVEVYPADTGLGYSRADDGETAQPIAGRVPAHFGAVFGGDGLTAADRADLAEIDSPGLIVGDTAEEQMSNAYAAYERDEGFFIVPHGPVKPPYGSPEREAYDREHKADRPVTLIRCGCGPEHGPQCTQGL